MLLAGLALPAAAQPPQSPSFGIYAEAAVEAWSNGLPILDVAGDWSQGYRQRQGPQNGYAMARAEAGVRAHLQAGQNWGDWRLGALQRADASARLSGEAAHALYHYQSRTDPLQPRSFKVDADVLLWTGRGFALHLPTMRWRSFEVDVGWDHMVLQRMRALSVAGAIRYNADGSYGYKATLRDDDARKTTPFLAPADDSGRGDALSLRLAWSRPEAGSERGLPEAITPRQIELVIQDVWSRLAWQGVNGDDAVLDSNVTQRTPEGYVEYRAAINGKYTRREVVERIPVTTGLSMAWGPSAAAWTLQVQERLGLWQYWLGYRSRGTVGWRVAAEPVAGALLLGADWAGLRATVFTSRLDGAARARGGSVSWALMF